jgi:hypothetical protein
LAAPCPCTQYCRDQALLELATGGKPRSPQPTVANAQRRFRMMVLASVSEKVVSKTRASGFVRFRGRGRGAGYHNCSCPVLCRVGLDPTVVSPAAISEKTLTGRISRSRDTISTCAPSPTSSGAPHCRAHQGRDHGGACARQASWSPTLRGRQGTGRVEASPGRPAADRGGQPAWVGAIDGLSLGGRRWSRPEFLKRV